MKELSTNPATIASREWRKRNPGKAKEYRDKWLAKKGLTYAELTREWRKKNPERAEQNRVRSVKKAKSKRFKTRKLNAFDRSDKFTGGKRSREIAEMHAKGKDVVTIAIRLSIPVSKVQSVLAAQK